MTVLEAKLIEPDKRKKYKVYEEVPDNGQKTISVCWLCTEKDAEKGKVTKACLVARGHEEEDNMFRKDSPTCSNRPGSDRAECQLEPTLLGYGFLR